jgi:RNA recognition motif-containing protein
MNIYVATISPRLTEEEIKEAFAAYGKLSSVELVKGRYTGNLIGFGFIKMPRKAEAEAAIAGLNGKKLKGKKLTVKEARSHRGSFRDDRREKTGELSFGHTTWSR